MHRNPLSVTMPPAEPLRGADLVAFKAATSPTLARMESMEQLMFAHVATARAKKR